MRLDERVSVKPEREVTEDRGQDTAGSLQLADGSVVIRY